LWLEIPTETVLSKFGMGIKFSRCPRLTFAAMENVFGNTLRDVLAMLKIPALRATNFSVALQDSHIVLFETKASKGLGVFHRVPGTSHNYRRRSRLPIEKLEESTC
jgi:hypothetical protein